MLSKIAKKRLVSDTSEICHLWYLTSDELESSVIILPCIFIIGINSIGSVHTSSSIGGTEVDDDIFQTIDIFLGRGPVGSDDIHPRLEYDISIRVSIGLISTVLRKEEEWREWSRIEPRVIYGSFVVSSCRDTISASTWTDRPSPVLDFSLSLESETLIDAIIREEWCWLIPCEEPSGSLWWSLRLSRRIASCPDLTSDEYIRAGTSRIRICLSKLNKTENRESQEKIFSHSNDRMLEA